MSDTRTWGNYVLKSEIRFGSAARRNRGRYAGSKVHRLYCEYVVAVVDEAAELALPYATIGKTFLRINRRDRAANLIGGLIPTATPPVTPVLFSCSPCCGCTQGQHAGQPGSGYTADNVNCDKCKQRA